MATATPTILCISVENDCTRNAASTHCLALQVAGSAPEAPSARHRSRPGTHAPAPRTPSRSASPCWCRTKTLPMNGRSASSVAMSGPLLSCWRLLTLGRRSRGGGHRYQRHLSASCSCAAPSCRQVGRSTRRMVKDAAGGPIEGRHARVVQLRQRMASPVIERGTPIIWFHLGYAPLPGLSLISRLQIPVKPLACCCSPTPSALQSA